MGVRHVNKNTTIPHTKDDNFRDKLWLGFVNFWLLFAFFPLLSCGKICN